MQKKLIRDEKYIMLTKQISQLEKDLISFKNSSDKKEGDIQNFMNEILKTNNKIIEDLKLLEDIASIQTNLDTQNIEKIKILDWLIHFSLGMNIGVVILLVFLKIKGAF